MLLTRQAEYGVRVMLEVARHEAGGSLSTTTIATSFDIPLPFLKKTVGLLVHHHLLLSRRGVGGGLSLARDAARISLRDIVVAIDGQLTMIDCSLDGETCGRCGHCAIHAVFGETATLLDTKLRSVTLADLVLREKQLTTPAGRRRAKTIPLVPSV